MISDEMLSQAAAKVAVLINESLPEASVCNHPFSARFERKMGRIIRRANHPILYRTLRSVASILLVMMFGFGSVLAINAEAREIVFGWVKQQYETFYEYLFEGEANNSETNKYYPGWVPDGCELVTIQETAGGEIYIYTDDQDTLIQFYYIFDPDSQKMFVDTVKYIKESVIINGHSGEVFISLNEAETNSIVWTDNSKNVLFYISGNFEKEVLIKMAENVVSKK